MSIESKLWKRCITGTDFLRMQRLRCCLDVALSVASLGNVLSDRAIPPHARLRSGTRSVPAATYQSDLIYFLIHGDNDDDHQRISCAAALRKHRTGRTRLLRSVHVRCFWTHERLIRRGG